MSFTILPDKSTAGPPRPRKPQVPVAAVAAVVAVVVLGGGVFAYKTVTRTSHPAALPPRAVAAAAAAHATPTATPGSPTAVTPASSAAAVVPATSAPAVVPVTPVPSASTPVVTPAAPVPAIGTVPPAAALLAKANKAALAAGWAHYEGVESTAGDDGTDSYDFIGNAGPGVGSESGSVDGEGASTVVVGSTAYLKATAEVLLDELDLSEADANALAGRWLSIPSTDPDFDDVSEGVTMQSTLDDSDVEGILTLLPSQIRDGVRVVGVRGLAGGETVPPPGSTATMWISTRTNLPVEFDETNPEESMVLKFSKWGVRVAVAAPAGAVPLDNGAST